MPKCQLIRIPEKTEKQVDREREFFLNWCYKELERHNIPKDVLGDRNPVDLFDSKISLAENKSAFKTALEESGLVSVVEKQYKDKDYVDDLIEQQKEIQLKETKKEELKAIEEIKSTATTPILEKSYWVLNSYVGIVANPKSRIYSLFVLGKAGTGKTTNIKKKLVELNAYDKDREVKGKITPKALYEALFRYGCPQSQEYVPNSVYLFDDTIDMMKESGGCMAILYPALTHEKVRIIKWQTSKKETEIPHRFRFDGRVVFCLNSVPKDNVLIQTLMSRTFKYELKFTYEQLIRLMYEIAKLKHPVLTKEERFGIVDYIRESTSPATKDFDLRLQTKAEELYMRDKENWKVLLAPQIEGMNEDMELVRQLVEKYPDEKAIEMFKERTGKSERTFKRYKTELKWNRRK